VIGRPGDISLNSSKTAFGRDAMMKTLMKRSSNLVLKFIRLKAGPGVLKPLARIRLAAFCILAAGALCTCGMDDYIYLYPVQEGNITIRLTEEATVRLPPPISSEVAYFTHFTIYYRIYISESPASSEINTPELMRTFNESLANDYSAIYPSTSNNASSTTVNTAIGSLFSGRRYYELALSGGTSIESILDSSAQGEELVITFPGQINVRPTFTIGGNTYTLYRSTGSGAFTPRPDRYFINSSELNRTENANATLNADVADQSRISGKRYAYVSMYIVKMGRDVNTLSTIYSAPTFVGIFKLPDDS
jgi:hypothetical protein